MLASTLKTQNHDLLSEEVTAFKFFSIRKPSMVKSLVFLAVDQRICKQDGSLRKTQPNI
jgi:hypothetical protein